MDAQEMGRRIRAERERRQWTQQQLAEKAGVAVRTVGGWERGETVPQNRLGALEFVLDVDLGSGRAVVDVPVPDVRADIVVTIPVARLLSPDRRRAAEAAARGAAEAVLAMEADDHGDPEPNGL
jgi:transcriptional regulator with XRE-family HTH domain